jgi:hypothetical protein
MVELLPFVSDVPARADAFADGVRPPLSLIIQALFNVRVLFFVDWITVAAVSFASRAKNDVDGYAATTKNPDHMVGNKSLCLFVFRGITA